MTRFLRRARIIVLRTFERIQRPAAWLLLLGGAFTFLGVITGLLATGDFKVVTLLVAADLVVSGFSAVQNEEDDE